MAPRNTKLIEGDKGKMLQANDAKMRGRAENAKSKIFRNLANPDGGKTGMGLDDENVKLKKPPVPKSIPKGLRKNKKPKTTKTLKMKEGSGISGKSMKDAPNSNVDFKSLLPAGIRNLAKGLSKNKLKAGGKVKKMMGGGMTKGKMMKYRGGGMVSKSRPTKYI